MKYSRILPLVIATALFMENMDSSIIATSLPAMAKDLGTSPVALKLAFTTYLLSLTVFLPISSWIADKFGAKRIFRYAIVLFTVASLCCGAAPSLFWLVAARALQGLGGAMMAPVGRIILLRNVPKVNLVNAMAWLTFPALIGPLVGPPIGGFITTYFSWHWIFWMHLPIGILGVILTTVLMPEQPPEEAAALDMKGFLLSGIGLSFTVFGFTILGRGLFSWPETLTLVCVGMLLTWAYVRHAHAVVHPILDLRLLRYETLRVSLEGGFFFRMAAGAVPFLLPLLLQIGFHATPFQSGLITCATAAGAMAMKFLVARILRAVGFRRMFLINGVIGCAFMAACALFTQATPAYIIALTLLLGGLSRSLQFTSLNTFAYADIANPDIARANSLYTVNQQLSMAMGVAFAALVLDGSVWWRGASELGQADFAVTFVVVGLLGLLALPFYYSLKPTAGAGISGHVTA
ncbi:MAG: MFS transporter [Pseudomonadota bacterium]|nr:MFS transporter [Pseudomonadota bacterium]